MDYVLLGQRLREARPAAKLFGAEAAWHALWISGTAVFAQSLFLTRREIREKVRPLEL